MKRLLPLLLLAACAPVMKTDYELVQPKSVQGRICARECKQPFDACAAACEASKNQCDSMARLDAMSDYQMYLTDQAMRGRPGFRTEGDFYRLHDYSCSSDSCIEACKSGYNVCYTDCGGKVIPHSYCAENCN